ALQPTVDGLHGLITRCNRPPDACNGLITRCNRPPDACNGLLTDCKKKGRCERPGGRENCASDNCWESAGSSWSTPVSLSSSSPVLGLMSRWRRLAASVAFNCTCSGSKKTSNKATFSAVGSYRST